MTGLVVYEESRIIYRGTSFFTGRYRGQDVIMARTGDSSSEDLILAGGEKAGGQWVCPASYENMLTWERELAPQPHLVPLNRVGYKSGFGSGNRIVVARSDVSSLGYPGTFGGWDGIYRGMIESAVPFWFVQQSVVRELIPEGVDPSAYPGIGHTGGYGPRELLRAGLFAYASLGGYGGSVLPIGADADHAIVTGDDEESLAASMALNKLALTEARDYTKYTVDTSHLFDFPSALSDGDRKRILSSFRRRRFNIANILPGRPGFEFHFEDDEIIRFGHKYWKACSVHKEIYEHVVEVRGDDEFDYELSLDETPKPTEARELLFYMVLLQEVMGLPSGAVASVGPNIGFVKRHDFEGDLDKKLWPQTNVSASILSHFGAMLSVHSADGVNAATGKGVGVDTILASATGGQAELKVADVYQEILWEVLSSSEETGERELFLEAWRRTYEAAGGLVKVYQHELISRSIEESRDVISSPAGREAITHRYGVEALMAVQKTIGYGLPVFRLASELLSVTDPEKPEPHAELFRRFMFLAFRDLRRLVFANMSSDGWERFANAVEEATLVRIRGMGWERVSTERRG